MKIEAPKSFLDWFEEYKLTANYFMATDSCSEDEIHAVFLCMRDAFIKSQSLTK